MLWITARITENTTHWACTSRLRWTAIWAAIVLSIVSWVRRLVRDSARSDFLVLLFQ
jgi:putative membrane protein